MSVLRYYKMAECDERGYPLDWEQCRTCDGKGYLDDLVPGVRHGTCATCDGHGSLKAAALFWLLAERGGVHTPNPSKGARCEDCGHPMSEGTWEEVTQAEFDRLHPDGDQANVWLSTQNCPFAYGIHYSSCDEGCDHGGAGRRFNTVYGSGWVLMNDLDPRHPDCSDQASWRSVDVRLLDWPHDLRPESLAVLCLRCWADRTKAREDRPGDHRRTPGATRRSIASWGEHADDCPARDAPVSCACGYADAVALSQAQQDGPA